MLLNVVPLIFHELSIFHELVELDRRSSKTIHFEGGHFCQGRMCNSTKIMIQYDTESRLGSSLDIRAMRIRLAWPPCRDDAQIGQHEHLSICVLCVRVGLIRMFNVVIVVCLTFLTEYPHSRAQPKHMIRHAREPRRQTSERQKGPGPGGQRFTAIC